MAKKTVKVRSLSSTLAGQMPEIARRVLGKGGSNITTPYRGGDGEYWMQPVTVEPFPMADDSAFKSVYTCQLFRVPWGGSPIDGASVQALNTYEQNNTVNFAGGYPIDTSEDPACGAIVGVSPVPCANQRYPLSREYRVTDENGEDAFYRFFTDRNDPIIHQE